MDEEQIRVFRNKAAGYFERVLLTEGYDAHRSSELAFFIAKVLEDTHLLMEDIEADSSDTNKVLDHIHILYNNAYAFSEGHKILMYKD
jgi:hypothetical protein